MHRILVSVSLKFKLTDDDDFGNFASGLHWGVKSLKPSTVSQDLSSIATQGKHSPVSLWSPNFEFGASVRAISLPSRAWAYIS